MMEPVGVYGLMVWPPPEASDHVQLWEHFGEPAIPLGPGRVIRDLRRWFSPGYALPSIARRELVV